MSPAELVADYQAKFPVGKYRGGLLLGLLDVAEDFAAHGPYRSHVHFLEVNPRVKRSGGRVAIALSINAHGIKFSLRNAYRRWQHQFRDLENRGAFPGGEAEAAQRWRTHTEWFDAVVTFSPEQRTEVRSAVVAHIRDQIPVGSVGTSRRRRPRTEEKLTIPPGFAPAVTGLLAHFGEILRDRELDSDARVSILRQGSELTLRIEHSEGHREEVRGLLDTYLAVVSGNAEVAAIARTPTEELALRMRLNSAQSDLRNQIMLNKFALEQRDQDRRQIGLLRDSVGQLTSLLAREIATNEELIGRLTLWATQANAQGWSRVEELVKLVRSQEPTSGAIREARTILVHVKKEDPALADRLKTAVVSAVSAAIGRTATAAATALVNAPPAWLLALGEIIRKLG